MPWVTLFQQGVEGVGGGMAATRGIGHGGRVSISEDGVFPTMLLELLYHGGHPHLKNLSKDLNSILVSAIKLIKNLFIMHSKNILHSIFHNILGICFW